MSLSEKMDIQIPFNKPYLIGTELTYIQEAAKKGKLSGNGDFTQRCQQWMEQTYGFTKCLLTTSGTDALEMAALILDIQPGDEIIVPSFTFVSSANAFALRGAKLVFVDSKPDFPGLDELALESLISPRTRAILAVHYAGVACDMEFLQRLCEQHHIYLIEDAAQALGGFYEEKALGRFGQLAAFSFHETKNIHSGEGGMLVINDPKLIAKAEVIWEKGTDRSAFFRGELDKYGWKSLGSSFLPSELTAAFLWAQLENSTQIQQRRKAIWKDYYHFFSNSSHELQVLDSAYLAQIKDSLQANMQSDQRFTIQTQEGNYHLFYLLLPSGQVRDVVIADLKRKGILSVFHYQSLHRSEFSQHHFPDQYLRYLPHSDHYSDCLLRLPLFYELPELVKDYPFSTNG
ncbi:dTDP-4-amino-4,6-dideoxygalactose transaminase [Algoriphagus sp.]|uniref:dTDP-4-amino-4,6-dideoxygalactose transaminase n=1 Tax=Algoriphagus sp. TaxID=1872435 RepID=UPI00260F3478|nr:dTDP-4-amino-4,6-dideoxygalactose transaminase [Algoriphagus sp.]